MNTPGEEARPQKPAETEEEINAWVEIEFLEDPPSTVVMVLGGYLQQKEAKKLSSKVESLLAEGIRNVVFDMSDVQYANSSAMGAFTNSAASIKGHGGIVVLQSLRPNVRMVFVTLGLLGMFTVASTREEALKAIS